MNSAKKDSITGKWYIQYRYTDWQGKQRKSTKRGFRTKKEAESWLRNFLAKQAVNFDMKMKDFIDIYMEDCRTRLRQNTFINKEYVIKDKIIPYLGGKSVSSITAADIRRWQNVLMEKGYKETYLKTINNQLNAIFNYAVSYYDLGSNPCRKAGSMGKSRATEMPFWTVEEFESFIDQMIDKRISYVAFKLLFWTGLRKGELLALTRGDIDLDAKLLTVSKSYHRIHGSDVITQPKTPKSNRTISLPDFLVEDLKEYFDSIYGLEEDDRIFPVTEHYLNNEIKRGIKKSGVKEITVHNLRHSHAAMLANMKIMPLEVANRLGHEKVETTLEIYEHLYPDSQMKLANEINRRYGEEEENDDRQRTR